MTHTSQEQETQIKGRGLNPGSDRILTMVPDTLPCIILLKYKSQVKETYILKMLYLYEEMVIFLGKLNCLVL